jgi:beta-exotoxin I transport system ATP-binding protein
MPADPLLRTEDLTKDYGDVRALDSLTLSLAAGEVFGLLGPNGSGKSTALRILLGFLKPTAGRAWIAGHDCWHDGVAARKQAVYLPGELRLYENMTGRQIVGFLSDLRGHRPDDADLGILAKRFDIDLSRPLVQLSSGMKRKVALLSVLVPRVPLVILDEPTNTLDPTMRDELLGQLREARNRGQTVLFSSHVLAEVEQVCDRVGILQRGRLAHLQTMADILAERRVRVRFEKMPTDWPKFEGETGREVRGHDAVVTLRGPLGPLLDWLGRHEIADLHIETIGLAGIYGRYHGADA